jgi:hypothetical protein
MRSPVPEAMFNAGPVGYHYSAQRFMPIATVDPALDPRMVDDSLVSFLLDGGPDSKVSKFSEGEDAARVVVLRRCDFWALVLAARNGIDLALSRRDPPDTRDKKISTLLLELKQRDH